MKQQKKLCIRKKHKEKHFQIWEKSNTNKKNNEKIYKKKKIETKKLNEKNFETDRRTYCLVLVDALKEPMENFLYLRDLNV